MSGTANLIYMIKDRAFEILTTSGASSMGWSFSAKASLKQWLDVMKIDAVLKKRAETGVLDDLSDGLNLLKEQGFFNTKSWSNLIAIAEIKLSNSGKSDDYGNLGPLSLENFRELQAGVHLKRIRAGSSEIGIAYQVDPALGLTFFDFDFKDPQSNDFFAHEKPGTVFSGMGIMANNTNVVPAWATGSNGVILTDYWSPRRDGLIILSGDGKKMEILKSTPYLKDFSKRRQLKEAIAKGQIRFYTLGQLYLFEGKNMVEPSKSSGCVPQNIVALNEKGEFGYFKFYCSDAYQATEVIRKLGMTRAFNMDAQTSQHDYHVTTDGTEYGLQGIETIAYSKLSIRSIAPTTIRKSYRVKEADYSQKLHDYLAK